jgi:hypothetical protein
VHRREPNSLPQPVRRVIVRPAQVKSRATVGGRWRRQPFVDE